MSKNCQCCILCDIVIRLNFLQPRMYARRGHTLSLGSLFSINTDKPQRVAPEPIWSKSRKTEPSSNKNTPSFTKRIFIDSFISCSSGLQPWLNWLQASLFFCEPCPLSRFLLLSVPEHFWKYCGHTHFSGGWVTTSPFSSTWVPTNGNFYATPK